MTATPQSGRVVVVDDDGDLRSLVRMAIEARPGLEVVGEAPDGETALRLCAERRPGIVVLDLTLPGVAGRDVLTRLRERAPWIRVIIFTGSAVTTKADASSWGATGLVRKDQDIQRLIRLIEQVAEDPLVAAVELHQSRESPGVARAFVETTLQDWSCDDLLDDTQLLVSELVTNAVTHADSQCRLELRLAPEVLRVEVADVGGGSPEPQSIDLHRASGRGLMIVSAISTAWGIDPADTGDGKVVWAELTV
jgi:DNA-binding NarL/FixJ family response regulator